MAKWCYDGCNTMAGAKAGIAGKVEELEPRVGFMHYYRHALNLSVGDTIKQSAAMRDCWDTCYELVKLVKFSPKREAMLCDLKKKVTLILPAYTLYVQQDGLFEQKS